MLVQLTRYRLMRSTISKTSGSNQGKGLLSVHEATLDERAMSDYRYCLRTRLTASDRKAFSSEGHPKPVSPFTIKEWLMTRTVNDILGQTDLRS